MEMRQNEEHFQKKNQCLKTQNMQVWNEYHTKHFNPLLPKNKTKQKNENKQKTSITNGLILICVAYKF